MCSPAAISKSHPNQAIDSGIFLVDKPVGPSSFRIVHQVRRALGIKKVGHTGTLDPFASGLLVICAGRPATRVISRLMAGEKEYEAVLKLGVETDTLDLEGKVVATHPVPVLGRKQVEECLLGFIGEQMQTPPCFSALKHKGKPLYYYARRGLAVAKDPRKVVISELSCVEIGLDTLTIRVTCGKGTYVRSLAADIGAALGTGAYLVALRRLRNGFFGVSDAVDGAALEDAQTARSLLLDHCLEVETVMRLIPFQGA